MLKADPLTREEEHPTLRLIYELMTWSKEYRSYEALQEKELLVTWLSLSDVELKSRKLMKSTT